MSTPATYALLADVVLLLHALVVAFVIFGLVLVLLGGRLNWSWVRNYYFRVAHLAAIVIVALQAWLGVLCPLTTLEMALRERAGQGIYSDSFIAHWLGELLYMRAPWWTFVVAYTLFGIGVVWAWFGIRPEH